MMSGKYLVTMCDMGMITRFFEVAIGVVFGRFFVMLGRLLVMLGSFGMMICTLFHTEDWCFGFVPKGLASQS